MLLSQFFSSFLDCLINMLLTFPFILSNVLRHARKYNINFMVAPCINNIKHLIVQLMHTNYKFFRLLK